jgi:hypothetical protein
VAWGTGALYAGLGLVGALVIVFGLIGGAIPGTAGFARIDLNQQRVEQRQQIIDQLMIEDARGNAQVISNLQPTVDALRDDVSRDRRRQFATAAILYAILGAFFAAALARDLLQALVIGAGWTAYLGAVGLKKDYAERKAQKDAVLDDYASHIEGVAVRVEASGRPLSDYGLADLPQLEMENRAAKAL